VKIYFDVKKTLKNSIKIENKNYIRALINFIGINPFQIDENKIRYKKT